MGGIIGLFWFVCLFSNQAKKWPASAGENGDQCIINSRKNPTQIGRFPDWPVTVRAPFSLWALLTPTAEYAACTHCTGRFILLRGRGVSCRQRESRYHSWALNCGAGCRGCKCLHRLTRGEIWDSRWGEYKQPPPSLRMTETSPVDHAWN